VTLAGIMAVLHIHRTLTDGTSDDVMVADELNGDSSSPTRRSEVIGVHGRVQEMVLKFSMPDNGLYIILSVSDVNKTKFLRPRPPEVNKGTWRI